MSEQFADRSTSQPEFQEIIGETFQEHSITDLDRELEERLRSGDRQVMNELLELLQPRLLRRAYHYIRDFRHVVPAYLEVYDLVQEASVVILKYLEEARTKDSPLGYLITVGYQAMRYICFRLVQEPRLLSLDRPFSEDDETPLHEHLPTSLLPSSPYEQEKDVSKYEPLYEAISRLSDDQRRAIQQAYGIEEQAPSRDCEIERELGWSTGRVRYQKNRALAALALALQEAYPQYGQSARLACIPEEQWRRLDEAYDRLQRQGRFISHNVLMREARVHAWMVGAYFMAREGKPRLSRHEQVQRKLDQAYTALQVKGEVITIEALKREAKSSWEVAHAYLNKRGGS
jgi:RNA polymerase sigma factor (sigma-70 family)